MFFERIKSAGIAHNSYFVASQNEAVVIDPRQVIRAILYYPMTTGRNMAEILRMVTAVQTTDEHKVSTPANWQPGDMVVVPPPSTQQMAEERVKQGYECVDWYLCKKKL